jgi:DNA-binding CsgD family transcriptional regulator
MMRFERIVEATTDPEELAAALGAVTLELGFERFALTHHVDVAASDRAMRLHNYPERWAEHYDRNALGISDPVHRASHVTSRGFCWSRLPQMIPLTAADRRMLALGYDHGIGDGFTVPANVPGEARGSVSFVTGSDRPLQATMLPLAQLAGTFAFEAARRLWIARGYRLSERLPVMTDRQRDCLLWIARGKSDWETGQILGVGQETVAAHIKHGCGRYHVHKRVLLVVRALFDGTLTFTDILQF